MIRKLSIAIVVLGAALWAPQAGAVELGLTPSHVVGLWTNINNAVLAAADSMTGDEGFVDELTEQGTETYGDKVPADVLGQVAAFREKLDRVGAKYGVMPTAVFESDDGQKITPSVVFLNSGNVLDSLARLLIEAGDEETLITDFYARQDISGKTPSDAFAMVELANKRIDALMRRMSL